MPTSSCGLVSEVTFEVSWQNLAQAGTCPAGSQYKALKDRASNRVVMCDVTQDVCKEARDAGVSATSMYIDDFLE